MMKKDRQKLTLDRPVTYQIKVPGHLDERWSDWAGGMTDYPKYCNFSDFIMFPAMNIGLKQPCIIEDGQCVYCMKYKGQSEIPASLDVIYNPAQVPRQP